jgi:hypothetical protein
MLEQIQAMAEAKGIRVVVRDKGQHIQIVGTFTVNVYLNTIRGTTYYINGMSRGARFKGTPEQLVGYAFRPPAQPKTAQRKKRDSARKLAAWRKSKQCHWCGTPLKSIADARLDHIIPLGNGGSNGSDNLCIACVECDRRKGAKMPYNSAVCRDKLRGTPQ